jgi:hypothetical protein
MKEDNQMWGPMGVWEEALPEPKGNLEPGTWKGPIGDP